VTQAPPLLSRAVGNVLQVVLPNPTRPYFQRELSRLTGEHYNGVRQALRSLVRDEVVDAISIGDRPAFRANVANLYYPELQRIAIKSLGLPEALDRRGVTALKVAVFGSFAKGAAEEGSDLDVLVIGREEEPGAAERSLGDIARRIERQVSVAVYNYEQYRRALDDRAGFIHAVASGPLIELRGQL
jgi:predicted nucleotidyltransferase